MKAARIASNLTIFFLFASVVLPYAFAEEFAATWLQDYGQIAVMEVTGNYDAKHPDGSLNSIARQELAKEFLKSHEDEYDFIVVFSNFHFQMPDDESKAFYYPVRNDVEGIGLPLFDDSSLFGSNGKLQGMIDMGNILTLNANPFDPEFEETLSLLAHEQMHRWGAYVRFMDQEGRISSALLGKDVSHWSFLLDSDGSVLYGNEVARQWRWDLQLHRNEKVFEPSRSLPHGNVRCLRSSPAASYREHRRRPHHASDGGCDDHRRRPHRHN